MASTRRYLLLALLPALALAAFLLSANWPTYRQLAARGVPATGQVTSTACGTGGSFTFTFEAEGEEWAGKGRVRRIGLDCAQLTPGREVPVYFLPGKPGANAATTDPAALARNELFVVLAFGLVTLVACSLLVGVGARRRS